MAKAPSLDVPPTVFQEINLISNIYKSREKLLECLEENGYRLHQDVEIPRVECFLYTPKAFPKTCGEAAKFDFSKHSGSCLTLGVCIGGTTTFSDWDEKTDLAVQGLLKCESDRSSADESASNIFQALENFIEDFPELSRYNITLDVHICGYSLGGLFSQVAIIRLQGWADTTRSKILCRTYESCGLPNPYHEEAKNHSRGDPEYWKRRVQSYKSLPNPLNSVFADIGRVFHLLNLDSIVSDSAWAWKCFAGSAKRVCAVATATFAILAKQNVKWARMTAKQVAAALVASMAAELGLEVQEIIKTHNINLMRTCFDENGNMYQGVCREMRSWTVYTDFQSTVAKALDDAGRGLELFRTENAGLHTWKLQGGKKGYIERKLASFPGYQRLEE